MQFALHGISLTSASHRVFNPECPSRFSSSDCDNENIIGGKSSGVNQSAAVVSPGQPHTQAAHVFDGRPLGADFKTARYPGMLATPLVDPAP